MKELYALIWQCPDETFSQAEFDARVPRLMEWLRTLKRNGNLVACGGGGFEIAAAGLTIIQAESIEQAIELSNGTPMNEIGKTEVMLWDCFYGELSHTNNIDKLQ